MIKSIKSKKLKDFVKGKTQKVDQRHVKKIENLLTILDTATCLDDCDIPEGNLHPFKERKPTVWSLDVSKNYRITFEFVDGHIYNVDYLDTH